MSFNFKGCNCTLNNYATVFKGIPSDFIDEIRLAILDDTPIGDYLIRLLKDKDGANKLAQIRKALRDYVPVEFILTDVSAEVMEYIRRLYNTKGEEALMQLSPYINLGSKTNLSNDTLKQIIIAAYSDVDISKVDFNKVETQNVSLIILGLTKGYPMWLISEMSLPTEVIEVLMQGMSLGIDIHPFLIGNWNAECIRYLLANYKRINLAEVLENVNSHFTYGQLEEVVSAAMSKVDFGLLCLKEEGGQPVFNEYQMEVIRDCLVDDVLTEEIYDCTKSDMDMRDLYELELSKKTKNKRLGGSLKH